MITAILTIALLVVVGLIHANRNYRYEIGKLQQQLTELQAQHIKDIEKTRKDSKFRSSAANWGKSVEHFVPFMTKFPIPAEDVNFLGMPIDYVGFTDTESKTNCKVHFIEVKSGVASLSNKQRNIKRAIQEGRVEFHEIVVDSNRVEVRED
jgi:predicted Holliday junction resolvase-like endonuclease